MPPVTSPAAHDTDGFFGFVAGLYASALAATAVGIAVALRVNSDPGVLFFVLLGSAVLVTGVVGWAARRESLAVRLGETRWVWAVLALPLGYFGVLVALARAHGGDLPGAAGGIAVAGAVVGLLAGIGVVVAANNRHAKAVLADAEEGAQFTAPAPERDRQLATRAVVGLFVVGILGFAGSALLEFPPLRWLFQMLVPAGAAVYGTTTPQEVTVSDAGLVVGNPVSKRFSSWSAFGSYDVTDEAIVVRRAGWSPWGLRDVRRDAGDVSDPEAVADALGTFLPRRE